MYLPLFALACCIWLTFREISPYRALCLVLSKARNIRFIWSHRQYNIAMEKCTDIILFSEELQNEVYLVGRNKTTHTHIMSAMLAVNQAIRENRIISFRYQKYTIQDRTRQVDRRKGAEYIYSPVLHTKSRHFCWVNQPL